MRLISLSSATLGAVISLQSARSTDHALEQGAALARAAKRRRGAWTSEFKVCLSCLASLARWIASKRPFSLNNVMKERARSQMKHATGPLTVLV